MTERSVHDRIGLAREPFQDLLPSARYFVYEVAHLRGEFSLIQTFDFLRLGDGFGHDSRLKVGLHRICTDRTIEPDLRHAERRLLLTETGV